MCPSCSIRRMVEAAACLADHVIPPVPVRQWVLAATKRPRYFIHRRPAPRGTALRLFLSAVPQCPRAHSAGADRGGGLTHRFGFALNPHLQFHGAVLGVVIESALAGTVAFGAAGGELPF